MSNDSGKSSIAHKKHVARLEREKQQTRLIIYTFFGILAVVVLLIAYGWLDQNYFQLNRAVAKVSDREVLLKDFEPRVRLRRQQLIDDYMLYQQYQQYFGMDMSAQLDSINGQLNLPELVGQSVLDAMIDEQLVRLEAEKLGISISEDELNARIETGFNFYPNGTPTPTMTVTAFAVPTEPESLLQFLTPTLEATLVPESTATIEGATADPTATLVPTSTAVPTATLGPTSTPQPTATAFTREAFEEQLSNTREDLAKYGFDAEYYREFFETQLLVEKVRKVVTADVPSFEVQVRARHILVADEQTAKDLIARLQAGEDFAELAREFSTDTGSAVQGGDLGWFGKGMMVAEFETAAYALENPGDFTSEPVASQFGFHIIQLLAKSERPLDSEGYKNAQDAAFQAWLDAASEEYGVETFDFWKARVPNTPSFVTAATEAAKSQQTAQAENVSTLEAAGTETPQP